MGMELPKSVVNDPRAAHQSDSGPESLADFWTRFFAETAQQTGAARMAFLERTAGGQWEPQAAWPEGTRIIPAGDEAGAELDRLANEAEQAGVALRRYPAGAGWVHLAAAKSSGAAGLLLLRLDGASDEAALASATRALAFAALPAMERLRQKSDTQAVVLERMTTLLDITLQLETAETFLAAAMLLCNELAAHLRCDRVSLGWLRRRYVRLRAVSHGEQFQKNAGIVQSLELAMEEALDQDDEILLPNPEGAKSVARAHQEFATQQHVEAIATIPLRSANQLCGALCLERRRPFDPDELTGLRLLADQVTARLETLEHRGRWIGARLLADLRHRAGKLIGHEHTGAKLLAVGIAATLAALALIRVPYRVQAPFHLECDALAQLPAPFDGYIEEVHFRAGDEVHAGQVLVELDTRELLQQEAAATAELQQHLAEAQNAESEQKVADMLIAQAASQGSRASLDLIKLRLSEAEIRAPIDGVVVEGDLRERIAAPVKQGEVLLKVARISAIYPAVQVSERDVQDVREATTGEIAFYSQPQAAFAIRIERVQPVADTMPEGNVFIARAQFSSPQQPWWRPGMSGIAKINAPSRSLMWIVTHRTADFLRMKLWW
jgi:RND family efflux transporter MFP subunit